jgi:hypothetical protein
VNILRRLLHLLSPAGRLFRSTGVRRMGPSSLLVAIDARSYWVHVQVLREAPLECRVDTSDIRDITNAATVVAAPPASASAVPEVRRRLQDYFARSRTRVTYR